MKLEVEHEEDLTLPEDSIHRARLVEIKLREVPFFNKKSNKDDTFDVLEWWWEVTATDLGPKYVGRKVKGDSPARMTDRDGNKVREWAGVLLGRELPLGMAIDTDDLINLEAEIVIAHRPDRKDPSKTWEYVSDIAPADGSMNDLEPPF